MIPGKALRTPATRTGYGPCERRIRVVLYETGHNEVWSSADQTGTFMSIADFIGLIGVAAYLSAYGLLQLGILKVEDDRYALLNGIGAIAILYSLIFDFNLPSFITQAAWLIFTIIGYVRSRSRRKLSKAANT
jgi:hypothetical protein